MESEVAEIYHMSYTDTQNWIYALFYPSYRRLCVFIATDLKNSSVIIVTNDHHDDWGSIPSKGRCFSVPHHIQATSGAYPVIHWVPCVICLEVECLSINLANFLGLLAR